MKRMKRIKMKYPKEKKKKNLAWRFLFSFFMAFLVFLLLLMLEAGFQKKEEEKDKISEEERNILKEMEIRIDQLDFDEAEILMKRWEGME